MHRCRAQLMSVLIVLFLSFTSAAQSPDDQPARDPDHGTYRALHHQLADLALTEEQLNRLHPYLQSLLSARIADGMEQQYGTASAALPPVVHVIIHAADPGALPEAGVRTESRFDRFATARILVEQLTRLAETPGILYVEPGYEAQPTMDVSLAMIGAHLLHAGLIDREEITGEGVIMAVYDTGIDWSHPDFLQGSDPERSRIISIWDQTLDPAGAESNPPGFSYGVEYTRRHIEDELRGSPSTPVRSQDTNGHGTHVASVAAGGSGPFSGVAPGAELIIIKGANATYLEPRIIDGITYVQRKAEELGRPVVLNLSLGGYMGSRDGTSALELKIDDFNDRPGHAVVVSAGNAGHVRMHRTGTVSRGGVEHFSVDVPPYEPRAGTENDVLTVDIWLDGDADVSARVITPGGAVLARLPGQIAAHGDDREGTIEFFNVVNGINGHRQVMMRVLDRTADRPPASGEWTIELFNAAQDVRYDAWLPTLAIGASRTMISMEGATNNSTIAMPATARTALSVGASVSKQSWIDGDGNVRTDNSGEDLGLAAYSSLGPTRDGRIKPDVTAPGDWIAAARSAHSSYGMPAQNALYALSRGTSSAAPHVAGAAALLLSRVPHAGTEQIRDAIIHGASESGISETLPNNRWGYGRLDAFDAMNQILDRDLTPDRTIVKYDRHPTRRINLKYEHPVSVRHSPAGDGQLAAVMVHFASIDKPEGSLTVSIRSDDDGQPGMPLGGDIDVALDGLFENAFNIVGLMDANAHVSAGQDYHIVLSLTQPGAKAAIFGDDGPGERSLRRDGKWKQIGQNLAVRSETVRHLSPTGLPVELAHFTGTAHGSTAVLTWATSSEKNNHGFAVQREAGMGYETLHFVEGRGTAFETTEYSYSVTDLPAGTHRFRLKQVDFGGAATYSPVVEVGIGAPERYYLSAAYPNPFNPSTAVSLTLARTEEVRIDVYNMLGQRVGVLHDGLLPAGERHEFRFDASGLPSGLYVLSFAGETFREARRVTLVK